MAADGEYPWDIKDYAATCGVAITDDQLKYWRENDALPPSEGGPHPSGRGRTTVYSPGTATYAVALVRLLRKHDLADATWTLWLRGWPAPSKWWRQRLITIARRWDCDIAEIGRRAFERDDILSDDVLDRLEDYPRLYNPVLRRTRKLTGRISFATLVFVLLRVAVGRFQGFKPLHDPDDPAYPELVRRDYEITSRGLGVHGARSVSSAAVEDGLVQISEGLAHGSVAERLECLSDAEILAGALELAAIRKTAWLLLRGVEWLWGRHAFGLGHGVRVSRLYAREEQAALLVLWLVCLRPRPGYADAARRFVEKQGDAWRLIHDRLRFQAILDRNLALCAIWTPSVVRNALKISGNTEELTENLRRPVVKYLIETIRRKPASFGR